MQIHHFFRSLLVQAFNQLWQGTICEINARFQRPRIGFIRISMTFASSLENRFTSSFQSLFVNRFSFSINTTEYCHSHGSRLTTKSMVFFGLSWLMCKTKSIDFLANYWLLSVWDGSNELFDHNHHFEVDLHDSPEVVSVSVLAIPLTRNSHQLPSRFGWMIHYSFQWSTLFCCQKFNTIITSPLLLLVLIFFNVYICIPLGFHTVHRGFPSRSDKYCASFRFQNSAFLFELADGHLIRLGFLGTKHDDSVCEKLTGGNTLINDKQSTEHPNKIQVYLLLS